MMDYSRSPKGVRPHPGNIHDSHPKRRSAIVPAEEQISAFCIYHRLQVFNQGNSILIPHFENGNN
jgi:hypothetical protein